MGVFDNLFKKDNKKNNSRGPQAKANFIDDEWVEVTAGTRDEAIERAATALNATVDHLEIKWLTKDGKKLRARRVEEGQEAQEQKPSRPRKAAKKKREEKVETQAQDADEQGYDDDYRQDAAADEQDDEPYEEEVEEETEHGRKAKEFLLQIVQCIDEPSTVELYETNKTIRLEIESAESGLFIGKHGQTLEAIQHLMMKFMMAEEHNKFLVIDAEDYRIRREEALETKARKLAKKARKEKRPIGVEPMNAIDRRIVHVALKGEPGVETKSIGEGSNRRVLIVPKGYQRKAGGNNSGGGRRYNNNRNNNRSYNNNISRDKEYEGPSRGGNDAYDSYEDGNGNY
ncbi:MAG: KH domain-containing protein [Bdellovibrionota bacterium]|nr:KH domain-containing protein [Deltaproteobacteria bacterium]